MELSSLRKIRLLRYDSFQLPIPNKWYVFSGTHRLLLSFVENYSTVAVPLTDLGKKISPHKVVWTEACEQAFTKLKELLTTASILMSPDFEK